MSTDETHQVHISKHLKPSVLGQLLLIEVTPGDVNGYLSPISSGVGQATAKSGRAVLNQAFQAAIQQRYTKTSQTTIKFKPGKIYRVKRHYGINGY